MKPVFVILDADRPMGHELAEDADRRGYEVVAITAPQSSWHGVGMHLPWSGDVKEPWALALEGARVVVQFPATTLTTEQQLSQHAENHVRQTRSIAQGICACKVAPQIWLHMGSASWYRDSTNQAATEWSGEPGTEPHQRIWQKAEEAFFAAQVSAMTRKLAIRSSLIVCESQRRLFKFVTDAERNELKYCSWMHPCDWLNALHFLVENSLLDGPFNLCAPTPISCALINEWATSSVTAATARQEMRFTPAVEPARLQDEGFIFTQSSAFHDLPEFAPKMSNQSLRRLVGAHC